MSVSTVITLGYGSFGSVNKLPTLGYDIGVSISYPSETYGVMSMMAARGVSVTSSISSAGKSVLSSIAGTFGVMSFIASRGKSVTSAISSAGKSVESEIE